MDECDVINPLGQMRKQGRDMLPGLTVLGELPFRANHPSLVLLAAPPEGLHVDRLAIKGIKLRLVFKGVHVTGATIHEKEDHGLGSLGKH